MNIPDLVAAFEARYWCMEGPPRAYFEIWHDSAREYGTRFTYVEIGAKVKGRLVDNEHFLCNWVAGQLLQWPADQEPPKWHDDRGECLFWRIKPEVDEQEFTVDHLSKILGYRAHENPPLEELLAGGKYLTAPMKTSPDEFGWWSKIYLRLVIPGRDLTPMQVPKNGLTVLVRS